MHSGTSKFWGNQACKDGNEHLGPSAPHSPMENGAGGGHKAILRGSVIGSFLGPTIGAP